MPLHIRNLIRASETATLTTFTDPLTNAPVLVATNDSGVPISCVYNGTDLPLNDTTGTTNKWVGHVNGINTQVNTFGGFPGMTANAAGAA